ncbi:hypothetical protein FOZ61_007901 [Perkinsus olseni]|uniref:EF-hand domain-containing protein n=1 Tax=Perkinsus olseni TaxID=32597 RepID=A0A7J6MVB6_PEROL|nr:hypothetical protein FOZ61_007901 [Perkinsus olseni]KAF4675267.1 hypothetical protein FOL46_002207 [Perkinsus olseni]
MAATATTTTKGSFSTTPKHSLESIYRIGDHLPAIRRQKGAQRRKNLQRDLRRVEAELKRQARSIGLMVKEYNTTRARLERLQQSARGEPSPETTQAGQMIPDRVPEKKGLPEVFDPRTKEADQSAPSATVSRDFTDGRIDPAECRKIACLVAAAVCAKVVDVHVAEGRKRGSRTTVGTKECVPKSILSEKGASQERLSLGQGDEGKRPSARTSTSSKDLAEDARGLPWHDEEQGAALRPPIHGKGGHSRRPSLSGASQAGGEYGAEWQVLTTTGQLISIEHLKAMPPRAALREALVLTCGSVEKAYRRMDLNANGDLSLHEFEDGLNRLRIPWHLVSGGLTIRQVFKLFDDNVSGDIDINELVGRKCTPRVRWQEMPQEGQWKHYCNRVAAIIEERQRSEEKGVRPFHHPQWTAQSPEQEFIRLMNNVKAAAKLDERKNWVKFAFRQGVHSLETLAAHLPRDLHDTAALARLQREEIEAIAAVGRRIEQAVSDFASQRRRMQMMRNELSSVTEADARREELRRKSEAKDTARRELIEQIGGRQTLIPRRMQSEIFRPPRPEELEDYFSERALLRTPERELRQMARALSVPIPDAEAIQKKFNRLDADGSGKIDRDEFQTLVMELMGMDSSRPALLPKARLEQFWLSVEKDPQGEVGMKEFLAWYHNNIDNIEK